MLFLGAWGKVIHEKNLKQKISWHCPFNEIGRQEDQNMIYPITFILIDNGKIALLNSRAL